MHRVHRLAELTARGEDPAVVLDHAQHELIDLLGLTGCRFEALPYETDLPVLERSGAVLTDRHRYTLDGFELPDGRRGAARAGPGPAGGSIRADAHAGHRRVPGTADRRRGPGRPGRRGADRGEEQPCVTSWW